MDYSGVEDHEQRDDVGDVRVLQATKPIRNREAPVTEPQLA
jgi:hypothetical protein